MANGSSIALLLEHRGASVLLAADVFAPVLASALKAIAQHRGATLPLQLDAFKLSHHGSQGNITAELFECLQARHYVVSTNGANFGHPDDTAIVRPFCLGQQPDFVVQPRQRTQPTLGCAVAAGSIRVFHSLPCGTRSWRGAGIEDSDLRVRTLSARPTAHQTGCGRSLREGE